jgi:protein-L-isoaspartate(D-aspartate) O-methyltransferase
MGRDFESQRARMVERQLRRRGITDERVLQAMADVPRERFVPDSQLRHAYDDGALPIGEGQTISQPLIVATICEALALEGQEKVLEVGTGSGYSAAVLSKLAAEVISIEVHASLAEGAQAVLGELGIANVRVLVGDGSAGVPDHAPYLGIALHATAPRVPKPLLAELEPGGRLVVPLAAKRGDMLTLFHRTADGGLEEVPLGACRFVPLVGREGFSPAGGNGAERWR